MRVGKLLLLTVFCSLGMVGAVRCGGNAYATYGLFAYLI